jgi:DNA-binding NarL/FixJ family response regulator
MPDLLGVDAAAQIYKRRPTPLILLSAHTDPEIVLTAVCLGTKAACKSASAVVPRRW